MVVVQVNGTPPGEWRRMLPETGAKMLDALCKTRNTKDMTKTNNKGEHAPDEGWFAEQVLSRFIRR